MKIPYTQGAILRSQCRQRFIENGNCDGTRKGQQSSKMSRINTRTSITIVLLLLLCLVNTGYAVKDKKCPSMCSCTVESIVFCNNEKLTSTPTDFSPEVEKLYLFNNNITAIPPRTLRPLKNLKILDISGNRITNYALWNGIFNQLKLLENLMLQENQIRKITKDMFKGMTNLARIYLQSNRISVIEDGAFDNLPNLVELKLRNNRLVSFPKFEHTPNLLLLDLGYNQLGTIKDMALSTVNVEQLLLQNNRLTELRTSVFDDTSRLNNLDISKNRLTAVPQIVKSLTSLRILNMSYNSMSTIPGDTFTNLEALKSLYLNGMGLKSLPQDIVPRRVIFNHLDITENNWDCGCGMRWMPQYIRIFEQAFVTPNKIQCSSTSRLKDRKIKNLTEEDFECTDEDLRNPNPNVGPAETTSTSPTTSNGHKTQWVPNPCDVFLCFNGGTCTLEGRRRPRCRCAQGWTGSQCKRSLTTSTTTSTRTTTTTRPITTTSAPPTPQRPQLLISSITDHTVEIILPLTHTELLVSVSEIGEKKSPKEFSIKPKAHPFTVQNLEPGRFYNICIHLPLRSGDNVRTERKDTLCGTAKTKGVRVANTPASKPEITVVPSPGVSATKAEYPTENGESEETIKVEPVPLNPSVDDELRGVNNPETTPTESGDLQILYPAIGAGIGAVIIIIMLVMFCICRRQKRILKLKQQNTPDYVSGSAVDSNHTDMEMATVVHHHHHNHYNAGSIDSKHPPSLSKTQSTPPSKHSSQQSSFVNSVPNTTHTSLQNGPRILGRTSSSSSSSNGSTHDKPRHYSMPPVHLQQPPIPAMQYDPLPPQMNGRTNDYLYRNHQNSIPPMENHCHPAPRPDTQPLLNGMNAYYGANDMRAYPVSPMNVPTYVPPYPPTNGRSAFQPIQSPRNNSVLNSSSSESMPLSARVSTAHVMPTAAACLSRNLVSDNMPRYHEGVQVV